MEQCKDKDHVNKWSACCVRKAVTGQEQLAILEVLLSFGPIMSHEQKVKAARRIETALKINANQSSSLSQE